MPSDPDTVCKNGVQVSCRCLSFSPVYRFGDGHASIPDRPFYIVMLETLNNLSPQKRALLAALVFPRYPISWMSTDLIRLLDKNVVATFVSRYMVIECVLTSELV